MKEKSRFQKELERHASKQIIFSILIGCFFFCVAMVGITMLDQKLKQEKHLDAIEATKRDMESKKIMEVMDYTIYSTGKDRSALTGVLDMFLQKAQNAVSSALVGGILIAIGYEVDSVTGDYIGELSAMPSMLTWFMI